VLCCIESFCFLLRLSFVVSAYTHQPHTHKIQRASDHVLFIIYYYVVYFIAINFPRARAHTGPQTRLTHSIDWLIVRKIGDNRLIRSIPLPFWFDSFIWRHLKKETWLDLESSGIHCWNGTQREYFLTKWRKARHPKKSNPFAVFCNSELGQCSCCNSSNHAGIML
jgi:hypothetical protein